MSSPAYSEILGADQADDIRQVGQEARRLVKSMSMQQEIQAVIDRFHKKMEKDPELKKDVQHLVKVFNLDLGDESYTLRLKDARIYAFEEGLDENADVTVITTPDNLRGLIDGTLRPMRAYVLKKIQIKGKIDDLMVLKKLF